MIQESESSLLDQGKVISSSPGLDVVELPVNRYMFGEYDMRNQSDRLRFASEATGDLKLEYRKQKEREALGLGANQEIWVHKYPHWDRAFERSKPTGEVVLVDFSQVDNLVEGLDQDRQVA